MWELYTRMVWSMHYCNKKWKGENGEVDAKKEKEEETPTWSYLRLPHCTERTRRIQQVLWPRQNIECDHCGKGATEEAETGAKPDTALTVYNNLSTFKTTMLVRSSPLELVKLSADIDARSRAWACSCTVKLCIKAAANVKIFNFLVWLLFKCGFYLRAAYMQSTESATNVKVVWHM